MNARYRVATGTAFVGALYRTLRGCILFLLLPAAVHAAVTVTAVPISAIEGIPFDGTVATFTSTGNQVATDYSTIINWGDAIFIGGASFSGGTITGPVGGVFTVTGNHTYAEEGTYTTIVEVDDISNPQADLSFSTATVREFSFSISSLGPFTVAEGTPFSGVLAKFQDPGSPDPASSFTATIDWGDGTTTAGTMTLTGPGAFDVSGTHTYADEGSFSVSVTVDEIGANFPITGVPITINVTEADVLTPTAVPFSTLQGVPFSGTVATFADTYTLNTPTDFTATINWGDATPVTAGTISGGGATYTVSGNHTYASFGVFSVTVTLTDDAPGTATATAVSTATVIGAPTILKQFGAPSISLLTSSASLGFFIQNNNTTTALTGIAFSDTLPAGLVIATPNGLSGNCGGGTITATAGTGVVTLSGGALLPSAFCSFNMQIIGTTAGDKNNTTSTITSTNGGTGSAAVASITVIAPPTIAKSFAPTAVIAGATTTLTFTLTNPAANTVALTGVGFTDNLPGGLGIADSSASVCGGTLTTASGPRSIVLSGATIGINGQCQFSVTVLVVSIGNIMNVTDNVTSNGGGTGATASAALTAVAPPLIPTMSAWALALLAAILFFATLRYTRQRGD